MTIVTNIPGATAFALQSAVGAYSDEAYTNARKLSGTAVVSGNPQIDTSTETFIGQMRWFKPLNPTINIGSITDATAGTPTTYTSDFAKYIKTVRTHGAQNINLQSVVTQVDGLAKIARDFAETRAQDEHNAIMGVLKGVAIAEALNGAATGSGATGLGGQTFTNDPTDKRYGFYVDLGANAPVIAATTAIQGAGRAEGFMQAIGMAFKDYEPEYMYLVTSPEVLASFRSANLTDDVAVTEGNMVFNTIFNGKIRLIQSRTTQAMSTAQLAKINTGAGVDIVGTKTSFLLLPGAIAMEQLTLDIPVEVTRLGSAYHGSGSSDIWYRWGYVVHPAGYDWNGVQTTFPSDADYSNSVTGGTPELLVNATVGVTTTGTWTRKTNSALSLGILPVFHS
jgi:hypothetical protein